MSSRFLKLSGVYHSWIIFWDVGNIALKTSSGMLIIFAFPWAHEEWYKFLTCSRNFRSNLLSLRYSLGLKEQSKNAILGTVLFFAWMCITWSDIKPHWMHHLDEHMFPELIHQVHMMNFSVKSSNALQKQSLLYF